jgi:hypothetical protein
MAVAYLLIQLADVNGYQVFCKQTPFISKPWQIHFHLPFTLHLNAFSKSVQ